MPGLFGVVALQPGARASAPAFERMAVALHHFDGYVTERWSAPSGDALIGRIGLPATHPSPFSEPSGEAQVLVAGALPDQRELTTPVLASTEALAVLMARTEPKCFSNTCLRLGPMPGISSRTDLKVRSERTLRW